MLRDVLDREEMLTHLFNEAKALQQLDNIDSELKAQFVWYLCVRTAGFVEYSIQAILSEYFESSSVHQPIGDFVSNHLLEPRRFSLIGVSDLIDSFKKGQGRTNEEIDLARLDSSIQSIRTNRNHIAHGRTTYQLTMTELDTYFEDAKKLIRIVYEECNPNDGNNRS